MNIKNYTETEVRTNLIDPKLKEVGWDFERQIRQEYPISAGRVDLRVNKRGRKESADYVLCYYPNKPIAVIEAKKASLSASDGMQQAIGYAEKLGVPFVFASNGTEFIFRNSYITSGEQETHLRMDEFPSPEKLWQMFLDKNPISEQQLKVIKEPLFRDNPQKEPRYYQLRAINQTVERIAAGANRTMLVMATGTGKTYVAFQIIWRLWKAGIKKRILFLADRRALIDQTAANDFAPFGEKMIKLSRNNFDTAHEIYLALYQGLTSEDADDTDDDSESELLFQRFAPDFFDLVVVDECHRGSAPANSMWRRVLEYFSSATQIGLTATPKETNSVSNIDYFGEPIYTYSLKQGINDGYLAPYRVIRVYFDKDIEGFTPYEGQTDDNGREFDKQTYDALDYDRKLILEKRTKLVAKTVSDYLKQNNCRMDKTIFFCVDQEHAARLREALVNENADIAGQHPNYVVRMTSNDQEGVKQLDNFRDIESDYPVLVTTSKLLTTGVDVRTVKFIVLDANIGSMTEFKQIIGRGTRIWEDSQNKDKNKLYFTIFDFRNVTQLFHDDEFDGPIEQAEDFNPANGTASAPPERNPASESPEKLYLGDTDVNIGFTTTHYLQEDGKLALEEVSRNTIRDRFSTLEDFVTEWNASDRKTAIIQEFENQGVSFSELESRVGGEFDPFDLICHLAFGQQLSLTRKERANRVRKQNPFAKYGETAAKVLDAILTKYSESGIANLEKLEVLELYPISQYGSKLEIVNLFGGKEGYVQAISEMVRNIYAT